MFKEKFSSIRNHLSPFFLSKYYLSRDIRMAIRKYAFSGNLLDIGCGSQPYRGLFVNSEYNGIDFENYSANNHYAKHSPDYFFDKDYKDNLTLPFADESFQNTVCFQVLEHHPDPAKLVSEIFRITRSGGLILITFPFLWGIHEEPNDFQRYTKYGFMKLIQGDPCEVLEAREEGSLFSTIALIFNECLDSFAKRNRTSYYISAFLFIPLFFFQYISLFLDQIFRTKKIFFNYMFLIKKS